MSVFLQWRGSLELKLRHYPLSLLLTAAQQWGPQGASVGYLLGP